MWGLYTPIHVLYFSHSDSSVNTYNSHPFSTTVLIWVYIYEGFHDKMRNVHSLRVLFYKLKQKVSIIPIIGNFCLIINIKNVDARGNWGFQKCKDKEKKNHQSLPFISAFSKWHILFFVLKPFIWNILYLSHPYDRVHIMCTHTFYSLSCILQATNLKNICLILSQMGQHGTVVSGLDLWFGGLIPTSSCYYCLGKAIDLNFPQSTHLQNGYPAKGCWNVLMLCCAMMACQGKDVQSWVYFNAELGYNHLFFSRSKRQHNLLFKS